MPSSSAHRRHADPLLTPLLPHERALSLRPAVIRQDLQRAEALALLPESRAALTAATQRVAEMAR